MKWLFPKARVTGRQKLVTDRQGRYCTWVLLAATVQLIALGESQVFSVRPITVNEGLSQSHVTSFAQDREGFMWIGTAVGLNRYDGHEFRIYTHGAGKRGGLSGDAIYALHVDGKNRLWVGTDQGLDLYDRGSDSFRHYGQELGRGSEARARAVDSDAQGRLWVAVTGKTPLAGSVVVYEPHKGVVKEFGLKEEGIETVYVRVRGTGATVVVRDGSGKRYPEGFGVLLLDRESGAVTRHQVPGVPGVRAGERDLSFAQSGEDTLWVGTRGHRIFKVNLNTGGIEPFVYDPALAVENRQALVSHVERGIHGEIWVIPTWDRPVKTGRSAVYRIKADGTAERNSVRPSGVCEFNRSFVISSWMDRTGVLWAGLSGAGLCVADLESGMFSRISESSPEYPLSDDFVRSVWKTGEGILWIGTRAGLTRIDRRTRTSAYFRHEPGVDGSLTENEVTSVLVSRDGTLWVGTQSGGLDRLGGGSQGRFEHFRPQPGHSKSLGSNGVSALLEDRQGTLWIATKGGGLNRFEKQTGTFTRFTHVPGDPASVPSNLLTALLEDSQGGFWVGTEEAGLSRFDRASGRFEAIPLGQPDVQKIVSMAEDPLTPGVIWIATMRQGILRYDSGSKEIRRSSMSNSQLPSDTVYSVLSDGKGSIWAGTNQGLVEIGIRPERFRVFGVDQGLQSMEFNTRAAFRAGDGEILFGGVGGINAFYPELITQNTLPPQVAITQVRALSQKRGSRDPYEVVYRNDGTGMAGQLEPHQRELIFSFVGLHFADPARNRYRYRLEGFEPDWRDAGTAREATYTNLPPGEYHFRVKAISSRGVWSAGDSVYSFSIAKPFYQRTWFVLVALAGTLGILYWGYRLRLNQVRAVERALQAEVATRTKELTEALGLVERQAELLRETDSLKSRFITNVSHDFRTPLAITLGTLTDLQGGMYGELPGRAVPELETVVRNERRLLRLVNQLFAIARLESGKLRLRVVKTDVAGMTREMVSTFGKVAAQRGVEMSFASSEEPLHAYCDVEWIEQSIANLLVNAVKFTPRGGFVAVRAGWTADRERISVEVEDSGPGIPAEALPRIFERFYQTERGATTPHAGIGVGLSLAKEIVELHGGEIEVTSEVDAGSTFRVLLRPGHEHFDPADLVSGGDAVGGWSGLELMAGDLLAEETALEEGDQGEEAGERPTLVIAEDDGELRAYLRRHFQGRYHVLEAATGTEALEVIRREIPDLVLSDIMMPGLDGTEVCRQMRTDRETDFIPVILLTAKSAQEEKLVGLGCGADDYLTKPFEMAELKLRVQNCLHSRARLKARLNGSSALEAVRVFDPVPDSADAQFLRRVFEVIRERADDDLFSVEELAKEVAISRMHLYRRLKETTGKTPAGLLMEYRLDRAAQLLAVRSGTVSEVAYAVGFKSVSHFTRRFRERFGSTPSEYTLDEKTLAGSGNASQPAAKVKVEGSGT